MSLQQTSVRFGRLALPAAALLLAVPATPQPSPPGIAQTRESKIWRRGETGDPGSLDPHKTSTVVEQHILDDLLEGLTAYDGAGRLRPAAAAGWDISADKRTYTFHLRPDGRWSNGAPVVAEDFVFSFRRLLAPGTGAQYASIFYDVAGARAVNTGKAPPETLGVRALDPLSLEVRLEHPAAYFLAQLTHLTALPVYPPAVARWGDSFARAGRLVGNGAFVLRDYTPNDRLVLAKNPYFHDAASVKLDGEIIYPLEDRGAALRRFLAGEIDSYPDVPAEQIGFVRARLGPQLKIGPALGSYFFGFDTRQKPFDDVRVRQALSMAVDRRFLADTILGGTMLPSFSFVPPGLPDYGAPAQVTWKDDSPFAREDEARRLMAAAGYGPGRPLKLSYRFNQSENHQRIAVAVTDMWKPLGVETELIVSDATSYYTFLQSGRPYDLIRGSWIADYPDAQNFLFLAESDNKVLNYAHFAYPAYDALMYQAAAEPDAGRRGDVLHQAEALLLAQQPYLVLLTYQATNLVSPKLHGWTTNVMDHHPARDIWKE